MATTGELTGNGKRHCGSPECTRRTNTCWKGYGDISGSYYSQIKINAISRGLDINSIPTIEELWSLFESQNQLCALTGWPIKFTSHYLSTSTASLDRIDPNGSCTLDNVQWVHKDVNTSKWDYQQEYFIQLCNAVAKIHPA